MKERRQHNMKWKRLKYFRIELTNGNDTFIIGKDYGTLGNTAYYYIELNGKVIDHGNTRQRDAKRKVENIINKAA
jgi:hypothetical protein